MKHEHKECEHKHLKYCKKCDVVYCEDCEREWGSCGWTYTWNSPDGLSPHFPYTGDGTSRRFNDIPCYGNLCIF